MAGKRAAYLTEKQKKKIEALREYLKKWRRKNMRSFLWRGKPTPYEVLIAEFFLQRTKAPQVERQFSLFIKRYPSFNKLAKSKRKDLERYLEPLGLRKRVRLMEKMIKHIKQHHKGSVPTDYESLIEISGVGDYTASAIQVFALNKPEGIVDANTIKVFSALFNKKITREDGKRSKFIKRCAEYFSSLGNPRLWNWVLLDFAASNAMQRLKQSLQRANSNLQSDNK